MKEGWNEFACHTDQYICARLLKTHCGSLTLRRLGGVFCNGSVCYCGGGWAGASHTVGEGHGELEEAACPAGVLLAGDATFPDLQVEDTLGISLRLSVEAEGVVLAPLLSEGTSAGGQRARWG